MVRSKQPRNSSSSSFSSSSDSLSTTTQNRSTNKPPPSKKNPAMGPLTANKQTRQQPQPLSKPISTSTNNCAPTLPPPPPIAMQQPQPNQLNNGNQQQQSNTFAPAWNPWNTFQYDHATSYNNNNSQWPPLPNSGDLGDMPQQLPPCNIEGNHQVDPSWESVTLFEDCLLLKCENINGKSVQNYEIVKVKKTVHLRKST